MTTATQTTKAPADSVNLTNKPEVIAALKEIARLKAIEKAGKEAKDARTELEDSIVRPALAGFKKGIVRGVVAVTESSQRENTHNDSKALAEGWPEAYEATLVRTPYTFLTVTITP